METIKIRVKDYYGHPAYYSVMPQQIFDALELAALKDEEFCVVNRAQFDTMIQNFNTKLEECPN